jgi:hypothetical protein
MRPEHAGRGPAAASPVPPRRSRKAGQRGLCTSRRVRRAPHAILDDHASRSGGPAVVIDRESGRQFPLTGLSARVWDLLAEEPTVPAIVELLRVELEGRAVALARSVVTVLDQWQQARLIVWT